MRNSDCHSLEVMVQRKKNVHSLPKVSVLKLICHWSDFAYYSELSFPIKLICSTAYLCLNERDDLASKVWVECQTVGD